MLMTVEDLGRLEVEARRGILTTHGIHDVMAEAHGMYSYGMYPYLLEPNG